MRIGSVGCVKQRLPVAAAARDLYVSPLLLGRQRHLAESCGDWFILSAKYGLVDKQQVLEPYDVTLKTTSTGERRRWSREVLDDLRSQLGDLGQRTFEVHTGSAYPNHGPHAGLVAANAGGDLDCEACSGFTTPVGWIGKRLRAGEADAQRRWPVARTQARYGAVRSLVGSSSREPSAAELRTGHNRPCVDPEGPNIGDSVSLDRRADVSHI